MAFKLSLVADVRQWLKGTADVEKSLDDVADSLDDLARDTKENAGDAADSLKREFSDAFDKVKTESKTTGKKMGDDFHDGTRKAEDGLTDFKDEANSTAREAAASFDGSAESIADAFQEVAANAFAGFGPAGAAAGLAAAAGIGLVLAAFEQAQADAEAARETVGSLADELREVDGNPALINWFERVNELGGAVVAAPWYAKLFGQQDTSAWEAWNKLVDQGTLSIEQLAVVQRAQAGDSEAQAQALDILNEKKRAAQREERVLTDEMGNSIVINNENTQAIQAQIDAVQKQGGASSKAAEQNRANAQAQRDVAAAAADAKQSTEDFQDSLKDAGSVIDDYSDKIIKNGRVDFAEWRKLQKAMRADNKVIAKIDAEPRLSAAARENFRKLPRDVQEAIADEFSKGGKSKRKVVAALNADAKINVDKVDVPKITAKAPVEYATKVDPAGAEKGSQAAADQAQKIANRDGNKIEFRTKVNDDGLQSSVNRAAAAINPPTIWVNVKAKKDVP